MERSERKEREFKARQAEILAQAEKIFAAKDFYTVTMAEIANASGFSVGSLYQYFKGKENLYSSMICAKMDRMYAEITEKVKNAPTIPAKIEMIVAAHFHFVENNGDFCRLFFRGEAQAPMELKTALRQKFFADYSQHLLFIERELANSIKSGYLRPLPVRDMAEALLGLIRSAAVYWIMFSKATTLSSKKDFILEVFLQGVRQNEK